MVDGSGVPVEPRGLACTHTGPTLRGALKAFAMEAAFHRSCVSPLPPPSAEASACGESMSAKCEMRNAK